MAQSYHHFEDDMANQPYNAGDPFSQPIPDDEPPPYTSKAEEAVGSNLGWLPQPVGPPPAIMYTPHGATPNLQIMQPPPIMPQTKICIPPLQEQHEQMYQGQPQVAFLEAPKPPIPAHIMEKRKRASLICGIVLCLSSFVIIGLGVPKLQEGGAGMAIASITIPFMAITAGVLGITYGIRGKRPVLIASMVMCIIAAVFAGLGFIFSAVMCTVTDTNSRYFGERLAPVFGVAIGFHLIIIVTSIVQSAFACGTVCHCCKPKDPLSGARLAYIAQPNVQLVGLHDGQQGQHARVQGQPIPVPYQGQPMYASNQ